jgi:hypothetical protein
VSHLGGHGVPPGGTECPIWGDKNMESMYFMDSHGCRTAEPIALGGLWLLVGRGEATTLLAVLTMDPG